MHTFVGNVSHVLESRVRSCVCVFEEEGVLTYILHFALYLFLAFV